MILVQAPASFKPRVRLYRPYSKYTPKRTRLWTQAEDQTIAAMWIAGAPIGDIAVAIDRTQDATRTRKCLLGIPPRKAVRTKANGGWSKDDDGHLAKLWNANLTTVEIGARLDRSKNSVIGRAHRIGLPAKFYNPLPPELRKFRRAETQRRYRERLGPQANTIKNQLWRAKKSEPIVHDDGLTPLTILQASEHSCRWPLDNGMFCGQNRWKGSFCQLHAAKAYR